jgi:hypothetical protein
MTNVVDLQEYREARRQSGVTTKAPVWLEMTLGYKWLIAILAAAPHKPGGFIAGMYDRIDEPSLSERQLECLKDAALKRGIVEESADGLRFTKAALDQVGGLSLWMFRRRFCGEDASATA